MGPGRKIPNVHQGDLTIEVYARDFMEVARQSATEEACLMVFFWGGRALQIPDALLAPRGFTGGVHQPGSEFNRLRLQG